MQVNWTERTLLKTILNWIYVTLTLHHTLYAENKNDSGGGGIIEEWLKMPLLYLKYHPFDLGFPQDPSNILPICLVGSRVESK